MSTTNPWRSFEEQLRILKGRGLEVEDDKAALNYLARIGYYRLSGYWYPMRVLDKDASRKAGRIVRLDQFVPGSRFESAVKLYVFDAKLRLLALDALERIELALRVDVAYLLGKDDPYAYKNPRYLHGGFVKKNIRNGTNEGKTNHEVWLERYKTQLHRSRRLPFVEHYMLKYRGKLPIWVAIEVWDFGMLSRLFSGMKWEDQEIIAQKYGAKNGKVFSGWLRGLNFIRNVSAHHSRLWNVNMLERAFIPKELGFLGKPNNERPFLYFCLMQQMLRIICPNSSWSKRFCDTLKEFPCSNNETFGLPDFGLVEGWENWDLWNMPSYK